MTDSSQKATPAISGALFTVGSKVQISFKYSIPKYRGQIGIINKVTKKGGGGKNRGKWLYSIAIDGEAFAKDDDVDVFEEFLSAAITISTGSLVK